MTPGEWLAASLAVALAALVQTATGHSFGTLTAAFMALIAPALMPGVSLLLGLAVTLAGALRERGAVDWRALPPALTGRALGALAAAALLGAVAGTPLIGLLVGLVVLTGVGLSLWGPRVAVTRVSLLGAGLASGLMATLTAVGAPPMMLLYQHDRGARVRATLNAFFFIGMIFSVAAVAGRGLIGRAEITAAGHLLPALVAGMLLARPVLPWLEGRSLRPAALILSTVAACGAILRALV